MRMIVQSIDLTSANLVSDSAFVGVKFAPPFTQQFLLPRRLCVRVNLISVYVQA